MIYLALGFICFLVFAFLIRGQISFYRQNKIWTFFLLLIPVAALGLYFIVGNPEYNDQPYLKLQENVERLRKKSADELIEEFREKLKTNDSAEARHFLGQTLLRMGRFDEGSKELEKAYKLSKGQNLGVALSYAEILIPLNNAIVPKQSFEIMQNILKTDKDNPVCLFYIGLYHFQNKNESAGGKIWKELVDKSDNQPWQKKMVINLKRTAEENNINLEKYNISLPDISAPIKFTDEQKQMIGQMVKSLRDKQKQNPNDEALKKRLEEVEEKYKLIMQQ